MKKIYIVFNDREKGEIWNHLYEELLTVFENTVTISLCFLDEIQPGDISDGDLYLVLYEDRIHQMKKYISSLDKVVVLTRTFERKYLDEVYALPSDTDILVVNDSYESTLQTINSLYELGLNHLNLIPYVEKEDPAAYQHINVAITPGEPDLVPRHISQVIDVQNRCIDANTFVKIINKLNLNNNLVTRNLLFYIQSKTESEGGDGKRYINDRLKEAMLMQVIQETDYAVIMTDQEYNILYFNDRADIAFSLSGKEDIHLDHLFKDSILDALLQEEDFKNQLLEIEETNFVVTKNAMKIVDQIIGYAFRFRTEQDIKDVEQDLTKQLAKRGLVAKYTFDDIHHVSDLMEKSIMLAKRAAVTDYTVLINGESGTGKELLAQSIHNFSHRKDKAFVAINCAALPESLLESELFGYEKGAFTGASTSGKIGLFEQANHGTIFLDEIGDMSLQLQARLLRVLQEKQIMRIGSDKIINIDIRIIAATNVDLLEATKKKEFRSDLYYRLNNLPIPLSPLRERKEDILHIFKKYVGSRFANLTEEELRQLSSHPWPGNIRELRNTADYYLTLGELPKFIGQPEPEPEPVAIQTAIKEIQPKQDIVDLVLAIIQANTGEKSGIGRTSILIDLKQQGIQISDDRLRKILRNLEESGKITVGKGRIGCMAI
ncbi:MAG: sigma 54-interacting transcriptional regulator [Firmicutes bacterium]|nr:sigma 54-interacting transcriptional regulator [Bacillota bacterium]